MFDTGTLSGKHSDKLTLILPETNQICPIIYLFLTLFFSSLLAFSMVLKKCVLGGGGGGGGGGGYTAALLRQLID